jgi:hypothetical protein
MGDHFRPFATRWLDRPLLAGSSHGDPKYGITQLTLMECAMGYFDNLAAAAFKKGSQGETIYYPNGRFGKGRVVNDPDRQKELYRYQKRLNYLFAFVMLYVTVLAILDVSLVNTVIQIIAIVAIVLLRQQYLIRRLPYSSEALSRGEVDKATSKAMSPALLAFVFANGIICIALGVLTPYILTKPTKEIHSLALALQVTFLILGPIFVGFAVYFYRVRKSVRAREQKSSG